MRLEAKMSAHTNSGDTKQVRVDNWAVYFLQRLQSFYSKTDFCDMTLQFEGNVQLKVHRLVINACTEYFHYLEQTCCIEDNVIMMPSDLQADVIVPIVNFMYTGNLEFHLTFFDKLYKAAQVMNITILTKLLDAQKHTNAATSKLNYHHKKKHQDVAIYNKKSSLNKSVHSDLPSPLPGRKLPIWKRKTVAPAQSHGMVQLCEKWNQPPDPLSMSDNTPKPTRFEWPDEDLPNLSLMDSTFEEISYTSKPLLTQEEEHRPSTSFDDLKYIPNARNVNVSSGAQRKSSTSPNLNIEELRDYVKEQKIRSGLSHHEMEEEIDNDLESIGESSSLKRKAENRPKILSKKIKIEETKCSTSTSPGGTTTISIAAEGGKNMAKGDHERIVSEILKKYPDLVKKNKNIKLKIMPKSKAAEPKAEPPAKLAEKKQGLSFELDHQQSDKPWVCERCSTDDDQVEFVLYYLYRKHMTDVHSEKFDPLMCKYCGHRCVKTNMLMYHLYIKHALKPTANYNFPKCDHCPYIALNEATLKKHKQRHDANEMQCVECKLAFSSSPMLTSHMQITGHTGKTTKNNFDCQYCSKKFNTSMNLFCHLRVQHKNEALRDGIVSIDESEDEGDEDDDGNKDEYILPEIINEPNTAMKKVNIISNVKVQEGSNLAANQLALEPSSEAEALNNVASGIATSLGLVEYVVLNDNQQLLFQSSNQQTFQNNQSQQSADFILPELSQDHQSSDGVITQQMLASNDIASTDELVMVLTDHDYGDGNQEEINSDNSNIVVLYSHPVDGQQDQYITTSQSNIMVNSETGMIEIRNGATISTTSANQVVMNAPSADGGEHIESIEMIQREIESHAGDIKPPEGFGDEVEEDVKPFVELSNSQQEEEKVDVLKVQDKQHNDAIMESLVQGEQLEFTTAAPIVEENDENVGKINEQEEDLNEKVDESTEQEENVAEASEEKVEEKSVESDQVDGAEETKQVIKDEEAMETDEIEEKNADESEANKAEEDSVEENVETSDNCQAEEPVEAQQSSENVAEEKTEDKQDENVMQVDDSGLEQTNELPNEELVEKNDEPSAELAEEVSQTSEHCEFPTTDEDKQQEPDENQTNSASPPAKISILDDWEDTDSQTSDQQKESSNKEEGGDGDVSVTKLMDDWEEEEEDDSRKDE